MVNASRVESRLNELRKLFDSLYSGKVVIVEGKKDARALRLLGVKACFVLAQGSNEKVVSRALELAGGDKSVLLLFDRDEEGLRKKRFFEARFRAEGASPLLDRVTPRSLERILGYRFVEDAHSKYSELLEEMK